MKRISAVFDGLKFSASTLGYAIALAKRSGALLSGVFLESFLYHSYELQDAIGRHGLSAVKMKHQLEKDQMARLNSIRDFEQACLAAQIQFNVHRDKGLSILEVLKESIYSDLLLVSAEETFSHGPDKMPGQFLRELLEETQCPVLVVPKEQRTIEQVILLFDGKPASVQAIKLFNYVMPWLHGKAVEVVTVSATSDAVPTDYRLIKEFISCHYPAASYTLLTGDPEKELSDYLNSLNKNCLVVLGAYQRGKVSRWFHPSLADNLLQRTDLPLFIAHL
ncbi:universal stress protein [Mucilaginibacter aquariorum]|uniref:Universal stress protein n=1 Tax=Mucilaginibacter aquariorum TaxID=2967225 RepID=A0ABT1T2C6_9SPHI|nr:universal stress protein [Mucilaginibacter aquariorum]MCQ6958766.1 universal stress protein [Mucilaginibacter aquariorum]